MIGINYNFVSQQKLNINPSFPQTHSTEHTHTQRILSNYDRSVRPTTHSKRPKLAVEYLATEHDGVVIRSYEYKYRTLPFNLIVIIMVAATTAYQT